MWLSISTGSCALLVSAVAADVNHNLRPQENGAGYHQLTRNDNQLLGADAPYDSPTSVQLMSLAQTFNSLANCHDATITAPTITQPSAAGPASMVPATSSSARQHAASTTVSRLSQNQNAGGLSSNVVMTSSAAAMAALPLHKASHVDRCSADFGYPHHAHGSAGMHDGMRHTWSQHHSHQPDASGAAELQQQQQQQERLPAGMSCHMAPGQYSNRPPAEPASSIDGTAHNAYSLHWQADSSDGALLEAQGSTTWGAPAPAPAGMHSFHMHQHAHGHNQHHAAGFHDSSSMASNPTHWHAANQSNQPAAQMQLRQPLANIHMNHQPQAARGRRGGVNTHSEQPTHQHPSAHINNRLLPHTDTSQVHHINHAPTSLHSPPGKWPSTVSRQPERGPPVAAAKRTSASTNATAAGDVSTRAHLARRHDMHYGTPCAALFDSSHNSITADWKVLDKFDDSLVDILLDVEASGGQLPWYDRHNQQQGLGHDSNTRLACAAGHATDAAGVDHHNHHCQQQPNTLHSYRWTGAEARTTGKGAFGASTKPWMQQQQQHAHTVLQNGLPHARPGMWHPAAGSQGYLYEETSDDIDMVSDILNQLDE